MVLQYFKKTKKKKKDQQKKTTCNWRKHPQGLGQENHKTRTDRSINKFAAIKYLSAENNSV